jgi:TRAP-type uncharacterized transport system fused permease subunit
MFSFYFAILSAITPPVALAVFAAAALAKTDQWSAGWAAMRVGAAGYIVPFMFVYEPALLMINGWSQLHVSLLALVSAAVGCICLAGALHGYLLAAARIWERVLLFIAALLLITPELVSSLVGIGLLAAVVVSQKLPGRSAAPIAQRPAG